jgi:hypothetical protein
MAPWAQDPSERPVRFVVPLLGLLGCGCFEGGVANAHGDHTLALRGVIPVAPSQQAQCFYQSTATFCKALVQSATGSVWS